MEKQPAYTRYNIQNVCMYASNMLMIFDIFVHVGSRINFPYFGFVRLFSVAKDAYTHTLTKKKELVSCVHNKKHVLRQTFLAIHLSVSCRCFTSTQRQTFHVNSQNKCKYTVFMTIRFLFRARKNNTSVIRRKKRKRQKSFFPQRRYFFKILIQCGNGYRTMMIVG